MEGKGMEWKRGHKGERGRGARTLSITNFWLHHWLPYM